MHEAEQEQRPSITPTTTFITIDGLLPGGKQLAHPLTILVEYDEGEVVVSEPQFHIHAAAPSVSEAIAAFKRIITGELEILTSHEAKLGARLLAQPHYLRKTIKTA